MSRRELPRAQIDPNGMGVLHHYQTAIPPHQVEIPELGIVVMHHAEAMNVARVSVNDGDDRIAIMAAIKGCQCGCGEPGNGIIMTPAVEHARDIAATLIRMADEMEAAAGIAAGDPLRKAAGK